MEKNNMNDKTILGNLETLKHIHEVRKLLYMMILELDERAKKHDASKLESPEQEIFGEFTPELGKTEYNSPEYKALLEKVKPAIDHHYANNSHHPEFHLHGIEDMNLIDILEMLVDWECASKRNLNGNINKSIEKNKIRFNISDQLTKILQNTANKFFH